MSAGARFTVIRHRQTGGDEGRADPFARFGDRLVAEPDDVEDDVARQDLHLFVDRLSLDLLEGNCGDTHHHNASLCASPAELSLAQAVPRRKNKTGTFFRLHKWPPVLSSGETSPSPTPFPHEAEGDTRQVRHPMAGRNWREEARYRDDYRPGERSHRGYEADEYYGRSAGRDYGRGEVGGRDERNSGSDFGRSRGYQGGDWGSDRGGGAGDYGQDFFRDVQRDSYGGRGGGDFFR